MAAEYDGASSPEIETPGASASIVWRVSQNTREAVAAILYSSPGAEDGQGRRRQAAAWP